MSLRTRLVAGLLALAAVGLLLLAGVTYAEQRHFLISRVDDQARQARGWNQRRGPGAGHGTWSGVRDPGGPDPTTCFSCYSTASKPTFPAGMKAGGPRTVEATN